MGFKAKWVLLFAFLSVLGLWAVVHLSPNGLRTQYEKLNVLQLDLFARSSYLPPSDQFKHSIVDNLQSILHLDLGAGVHSDDAQEGGEERGEERGEESEEAYVPKIAYIFAGSARSFACPKVHWSIRTHLIDAMGGDPHVFVRLSLEDNVNVKTGLGVLKNLDYSQNEVVNILQVLNPKKVEYFTFSNQTAEMKSLYPGDEHRVFRENDLRRYSMFYHRCMAYRLAMAYEKEHAMRFDWVVLVRVDAAWLEPVLPIQVYKNDRVWVTETGYDVFNDQFMLIPRQFSDYLYDLNTKVQKGVYCLGGPDVETWKCDRAKLTAKGYSTADADLTLAHCCEDILKGDNNLMGMSEAIHKRHLKYGKIPVSLGRFPVLLTRRLIQGGKPVCHPECFRVYALNYNEYIYRSGGMPQVYAYMASTEWPDRRSVAISSRDRVLCYYMTRGDAYPWKPVSAASPSLLLDHAPLLAGSSALTALSSALSPMTKYAIDYSRPLVEQRRHIHPSILQNPKDTEVWRIHPTWNTEGCLTFSFETKDLHWGRCFDHSRMKRMRYDSRQLFFLYVIPTRPKHVQSRSYHIPVSFPESTYSAEVANVTRVLIVDSEPRVWDFQGNLYCMTVEKRVSMAPVTMSKCSDDVHDPRQLFTTVRTMMDGTYPQSTVGQLQVAAAPDLCVARSDNALPNHALPRFERERVPANDVLVLKKCDLITQYHLVNYEFELIDS